MFRKVNDKLIGLEKRYIHNLKKLRKEKRKANGDIGIPSKRQRLNVERNNVHDEESEKKTNVENVDVSILTSNVHQEDSNTSDDSEIDIDEDERSKNVCKQKQNNVDNDSSDDDNVDKDSNVSSDLETDDEQNNSNTKTKQNQNQMKNGLNGDDSEMTIRPVLPGVQNYFSSSTDQDSDDQTSEDETPVVRIEK